MQFHVYTPGCSGVGASTVLALVARSNGVHQHGAIPSIWIPNSGSRFYHPGVRSVAGWSYSYFAIFMSVYLFVCWCVCARSGEVWE